jgi:hypothetical protein
VLYAGKLAGIGFSREPGPGKHLFEFITVGDNTGENSSCRKLPVSPGINGKYFQAWEHSVEMEVNDWSFAGICSVEQEIRQQAWDPSQVDSADNLYFIPGCRIKGKKSFKKSNLIVDELPIEVFIPEKYDNIFILSACADIPRSAAAELMEPLMFIKAGEMAGMAAATRARDISSSGNVKVSPLKNKSFLKGVPGIARETLRPAHVLKEQTVAGTAMPVAGEFDVVVLGGGTAGANAAISAARHGTRVLVLEYLHGLGGMGTFGMIGRYWEGYRDGFTREIDEGVDKMGPEDHPARKKRGDEWCVEWKKEWYRREIRKAGGDIWYGVTGCGAIVDKGKVKGVIIATPEGMKVVLARLVIDSTGSGDVAIAAGTGYGYTDHSSVGIQGCGLPPVNPGDHYNNTDWTFTDDNDIFDITRLYISAKGKYNNIYDIGKLSQSRERRRIEADYNVSVLDIANKRRYHDTISFHKSSFDTHGYTVDPYFTIRQPEQSNIIYHADLPLRSLLPLGLENIIVTGLGAGAHRDAMPVIRMQPCLQNQGYSAGYLCAKAIKEGKSPREVNIKEVQEYLVGKEILPRRVLTDTDSFPLTDNDFENSVKTLSNNFEGLEILLTDTRKASVLLNDALLTKGSESEKVHYAQVLCMLGDENGMDVVINAVKNFEKWDTGWNYRGMHQFGWCMGKLDSLIIALGMLGREDTLPEILEKSRLLKPDDYFSHFRSIAVACESIRSTKAAGELYRLLTMEGIAGHHVTTYAQARERTVASTEDNIFRNNVLKEIHVARALYRCGDQNGKGREVLENYSADLHGHYFRHAMGVLTER